MAPFPALSWRACALRGAASPSLSRTLSTPLPLFLPFSRHAEKRNPAVLSCLLVWGGEGASNADPALDQRGVIQEILLAHCPVSLALLACGQEIKGQETAIWRVGCPGLLLFPDECETGWQPPLPGHLSPRPPPLWGPCPGPTTLHLHLLLLGSKCAQHRGPFFPCAPSSLAPGVAHRGCLMNVHRTS